MRDKIPQFQPGDTVRVHVRIKESETKERLQAFEGVVIARKHGGARETITVRKTSFGVGVERIFRFTPRLWIAIEVIKRGRVRRAKLYYLRELRGKQRAFANATLVASRPRMPRRPLPRSNRTAADLKPWFKCDRELTLRIAIDAHAVGTGLGGNESYATNLIEALAAIDSVNEYTLYVTRLEAVRKFRSAGPTSSFVRLVRIPLIRIPLTLSAELRKTQSMCCTFSLPRLHSRLVR